MLNANVCCQCRRYRWVQQDCSPGCFLLETSHNHMHLAMYILVWMTSRFSFNIGIIFLVSLIFCEIKVSYFNWSQQMHLQIYNFKNTICRILCQEKVESEDLIIATFKMLTSAARYQVTSHLLLPFWAHNLQPKVLEPLSFKFDPSWFFFSRSWVK